MAAKNAIKKKVNKLSLPPFLGLHCKTNLRSVFYGNSLVIVYFTGNRPFSHTKDLYAYGRAEKAGWAASVWGLQESRRERKTRRGEVEAGKIRSHLVEGYFFSLSPQSFTDDFSQFSLSQRRIHPPMRRSKQPRGHALFEDKRDEEKGRPSLMLSAWRHTMICARRACKFSYAT